MLNSILFFRFIDDLFLISNIKLDNLFFENIYPNLKLNLICAKTVNFLDLNISVNYDYTLLFDLYIKPTNTQNYLDPYSNHMSFIFKNIPYGLIYRIKRICTNLNDFYYHSTKLHNILVKKGYSSNNIRHIIRSMANINRNDLIPYKKRETKIVNNFIFLTFFDKMNVNLKSILNNSWLKSIENSHKTLPKNITVIYRTFPNFNDYLVNKIPCTFSQNRYYKCSALNCKICKFSNENFFLSNKSELPILIPSISSCTSKNCIYFIKCNKCNLYYIGETSRQISIRIQEHLYKINYCIKLKNIQDKSKLKNFFENCNKSVALYKHFMINHNLQEDFSFQVFISNCKYFRLRLETDLILIFNTCIPQGLNSILSNNLESLNSY